MKLRNLILAVLALTVASAGTAAADDGTLYELGNGSDITVSCVRDTTKVVVHNIPAGQVLSFRGDLVQGPTVTAVGIEAGFGSSGGTVRFQPLGSFEASYEAPVQLNCWEIPAALLPPLPPALDERPGKADVAELTELQEKILRFTVRYL